MLPGFRRSTPTEKRVITFSFVFLINIPLLNPARWEKSVADADTDTCSAAESHFNCFFLSRIEITHAESWDDDDEGACVFVGLHPLAYNVLKLQAAGVAFLSFLKAMG